MTSQDTRTQTNPNLPSPFLASHPRRRRQADDQLFSHAAQHGRHPAGLCHRSARRPAHTTPCMIMGAQAYRKYPAGIAYANNPPLDLAQREAYRIPKSAKDANTPFRLWTQCRILPARYFHEHVVQVSPHPVGPAKCAATTSRFAKNYRSSVLQEARDDSLPSPTFQPSPSIRQKSHPNMARATSRSPRHAPHGSNVV